MDRTQLDPAHPGAQPKADPSPPLRQIGPFRILRVLGEGGMGAVYLAYDDARHRQVAIKVLADALAADATYVHRFKREARNSALLNHPSIVRGLDVGRDQATGAYYLVLEYVDGFSAHALLDKIGHLPVADAVHVVLDVARALEHAHSRNIIHRDIKPDNILLTYSGVAKLADLGLAKRTDEVSTLTNHRQAFGTPYYMPYEQALRARNADHRSDIFALGATFYHLLTGEVPFSGENPVELTEKKKAGHFKPASMHNVTVPRVLDQIIARMLAPEPADRYQTASELIVDLERTELAQGVPSFADPQQALLDPYVRERMASTAQPTQPDQSAPAPATPAAERHWHVRFRDAAGKPRVLQMSARGLQQRLTQGRLPADCEVRHGPEGDFHPAAQVEPFASALPRPSRKGARPSGARKTGAHRPHVTEPPAPRGGLSWLYWSLAASALTLGAVTACLVWLRS